MIAAADLPAVPFYNFLHQIKLFKSVSEAILMI